MEFQQNESFRRWHFKQGKRISFKFNFQISKHFFFFEILEMVRYFYLRFVSFRRCKWSQDKLIRATIVTSNRSLIKFRVLTKLPNSSSIYPFDRNSFFYLPFTCLSTFFVFTPVCPNVLSLSLYFSFIFH